MAGEQTTCAARNDHVPVASALGFKGEKKHSRNLSCVQDDNNVILDTTHKHAVREYGTKTLG